MPNF
jgi:hypothetical protein